MQRISLGLGQKHDVRVCVLLPRRKRPSNLTCAGVHDVGWVGGRVGRGNFLTRGASSTSSTRTIILAITLGQLQRRDTHPRKVSRRFNRRTTQVFVFPVYPVCRRASCNTQSPPLPAPLAE